MALISKPNTFSAGQTIIASQHNANFDTIINDYNGNITNANIASNAAIAGSKLGSLASITSAAGIIPAINLSSGGSATIQGSSLTNFASITSSAGIIPNNNIQIEGNWLGALIAGTTGVININATYTSGHFVKIGKQVSVSGHFMAASVSTGATGLLTITGLPYVCGTGDRYTSAVSVRAAALSTAATTQIQGFISTGESQIRLYKFINGDVVDLVPDVKATSQFIITGTYFID